MKKHLEVRVNYEECDAIVKYHMEAYENGEVVYTDKDNHIAKHKGFPSHIMIYQRSGKGVIPIELHPSAVKQLYAALIEIEAIETEEFLDPNPLPW